MAEIPEVFNQAGAAFVLLRDGQKFPPIEKEWQKKAHSFQEAAAHKGNVGIAAGAGYIGLDQDNPTAFEGLSLPSTTTWETRPGRYGMRFEVADDVAAALAAVGKKADQAQLKLFKDGMPCGEVKLSRTYQVIPPSWKKLEDGSRADYKLLDSSPPALINLSDLLEGLQAIGLTFSSKLEANVTKLESMVTEARQRRIETDPDRRRRYAEAALKDEALTLASTPEGSRNVQLNDSAFALGQFVGAGDLDEGEVIIALSEAAEFTGLDSEGIRKTILSGLTAGRQKPRKIPKREEPKADVPQDIDTQIQLKEVADIEYDETGKIKKVRFSPTFACNAVLDHMILAIDETSEDIYRFDGQIYRPDGAWAIDRALCQAAGDCVTGDKLKEILRRIRNELKVNPVKFDPDPYLLGVKNGVADLLTGEVRGYHPEDLITDQIPVYHDLAARCPAFLAFLESITPNVSDRITLIDWFVATAIKEPLAYVLFLLGLGRNGKGIYEKVLKRFFGKAAFRDMPLAEVGKNNFAAGGFYRKRGWIASETGKKKSVIDTDFMKLTSGNGSIDADRKNQSRIQFDPYFQTIVDTNTMPQINDNSKGWIERFDKADLPYTFLADPDPNNPLEKRRDPALFDKLTTEGELSGILNLLLFRSKAIGKSGQIHKRPGAEMFAEYNEQSSSVASFLELFCEYVEDGADFWTPSEPIYQAYCEWCRYKVGEVVDVRYFGKQLKNFCGGSEPKRGKDKDRKSIRLYKRLNFDSNKHKTVIGVSKSLHMSPSCLHEEEEEIDISKHNVSMSPSNLWNEIIRRFGDSSNVQNCTLNEKSLSIGTNHENHGDNGDNGDIDSKRACGKSIDRDKMDTLMETTNPASPPTLGPNPRKEEQPVKVRIAAKDGYRSQVQDPDSKKWIDRLYSFGEVVEFPLWRAKDLIDRGKAEAT